MSPEECSQDLQHRLLLRCFLLQEENETLKARLAEQEKERHLLSWGLAIFRLKSRGVLCTGFRVGEEQDKILEELGRLKAEGMGGGT